MTLGVPGQLLLRTKANIPLNFEYSSNKDLVEKNLSAEFDILKEKLLSTTVVYHLVDSNVLLKKSSIHGLPENAESYALFDFILTVDSFTGVKRKRENKKATVYFNLHFQISGDDAVNSRPSCAPLIHHIINNYKNVRLVLPLDVLLQVDSKVVVTELHEQLTDKILQQLMSMKEIITQYRQAESFPVPEVFHFQPTSSSDFLSVVYPKNLHDDKLEPYRKKLHEEHGLSIDRPYFRRANAYIFPEDRENKGYLLNPHVGLPTSGVKQGTQYLVDGTYSYHHYMQDRFDDNKWGCAYRSLQTLVSWFKYQGYTDKPIPTHKDIQQALVDVGDKEKSFVGSKKWIGSMEVSFCLDQLLGVTSRILNVSEGSMLPTKGRELAAHFETQGSPIMIGGGVLAHTILGVDYNEMTGDIKFLILDPHYTGAEDLKVIQDKGWCGWKGPEFWDKTAHYNMCLPQRPSCI